MNKETLLEQLRKRTLICDGAMGTELQKKGLPTGESLELWGLDHTDILKKIHTSYLKAGADIILTNTFGGTRWKLANFDASERTAEINTALARIAKSVAGENQYVLGDIGPTGKFPPPLGTNSLDDFYNIFTEQVCALVEGGVDGIIIETMTILDECVAAARAAKENASVPVIACMTFSKDANRDDYHTVMGVSIDTMVEALLDAGVDIIGTNCTVSIADMIGIIRRIRQLTDKPILAKPNAGLPELVEGKTVFRQTPEAMAEKVLELQDAGANIIGGCCGTTPEHIKLFAEKLRG